MLLYLSCRLAKHEEALIRFLESGYGHQHQLLLIISFFFSSTLKHISNMKLSQVKQALQQMDEVRFQLADGTFVPEHFHVSEIGKITKHFIDCGGTMRKEEVISFQLWYANDKHHRLAAEKLLKIIELSQNSLGIEDGEVEVEYQIGTIGKFGLDTDGKQFFLTNKQTACLANELCGVTPKKAKAAFMALKQAAKTSVSSPASDACGSGGCCC